MSSAIAEEGAGAARRRRSRSRSTTSRPPSAAIRIVVRSAAAKLDLRVVVMVRRRLLGGRNGLSNCSAGAGTAHWHRGWPLFGTRGSRLRRRHRPLDSRVRCAADTYDGCDRREPAHPGPGGQPAADRRRRGRGPGSPANRSLDLGERPGARPSMLGLRGGPDDPGQRDACSSAASGPSSSLVDEMERADLSRPGANLRQVPGRGDDPEEVRGSSAPSGACSSGSRPSGGGPRAPRSTAQEEERARVARDLHDEVNQSLTALLLRLEAARVKAPARARRRARRDQGARQPGDGGAADAGPPAPPHRARRPRPEGGARRPRHGARAARRDRAPASRREGDFSGLAATTCSWSSTGWRRRRSSNAAQHSGAEHVAGAR